MANSRCIVFYRKEIFNRFFKLGSFRHATPRLNSHLGTTLTGSAIDTIESQMPDGGTEWILSQIPLMLYATIGLRPYRSGLTGAGA